MTERDFIAEHVRGISSSGIRRVFDLGASLPHPINLSIGQPDFEVPEPVRRAMIHAIEHRKTGYTVTRGIQSLRDRLVANLTSEFDWTPDVIVTCGDHILGLGLLLTEDPDHPQLRSQFPKRWKKTRRT